MCEHALAGRCGGGLVPCAGARADLRERRLQAQRRPIRPVRGHRLDHVGDRQDARLRKDLVVFEFSRIPGAVLPLVVLRDDVGDGVLKVDRLEDLMRRRGVTLDELELDRGQ